MRLSLNGSTSQRMWHWRWAEDFSSVVTTDGSVNRALPPETENWTTTSTWLPWNARIKLCSLVKNTNSHFSASGRRAGSQYCSFGRNVMPTPGRYSPSFHGPVPMNVRSQSPS